MGLINLSDATPIYTGGITSRVRKGPVALIAQSGSAAISVINSSTAGFSKVVTIGSEYRVTGADYLHWLAGDDDTSVIGLVLESIPDADRFADAVDRVHAAGKSMVVLKVGRSATGARATLAHTGALIRNDDAFKGFVDRYGIPVVDDYEELIATLEAFAVCRKRPTPGRGRADGDLGRRDRARLRYLRRDRFAARGLLRGDGQRLAQRAAGHPRPESARCRPERRPPGGRGAGRHDRRHGRRRRSASASSSRTCRRRCRPAAMRNYSGHLGTVAELSRTVDKPLIVISPTAEIMSDRLLGHLDGTGVPPLRGLWPGLVAVKSMLDWAGRRRDPRRLADRKLTAERAALRQEIAGMQGPLPSKLVGRLLASYGIPVVKSAVARSAAEAMTLAGADRLPDGREGDVRRRAAPLRRRRGPARHHERGGPRARQWR